MSAQAQAAPVSRLGAVRRGTLDTPLRHLYYGAEGTGKTTLASHAPEPIVFDLEGGSARVELARYPFDDGPRGHVPRRLADVYDAIGDLQRSEHGYKTLVIDTLGALEALVWDWVCKRYSNTKGAQNKSGKTLTSIEDFGFAKGYVVALDELRVFCSELDLLRVRRGMTIVLLGHSTIKTFRNPIDDDFDRIQLRLHDKAAGFLREWADVVGFVAHEDGAAKRGDDGRERTRGYTTGRRLVHFERSAAWDAKTRVPLPAQIELPLGDSWAPIAEALDRGQHTSAADLIKDIKAELARLGDAELAEKVKAASKDAANDVATLSRYLNDLKAREPQEVTQ